MTSATAAAVDALRALPFGTVTGMARRRRYVTTKSSFASGRSAKLVAEQLGGSDYVSVNFYDLRSGPRLYPCEMPLDKVCDFLTAFVPDPPP